MMPRDVAGWDNARTFLATQHRSLLMSESRFNPSGPAKPMPPSSSTRGSIPAPSGPAKITAPPIQTHKPTDEELEPIGLVDEVDGASSEKKIQAFGIGIQHKTRQWKREVNQTGFGAVRMRSFHGRLSDQGLGYLDDAINEWLDENPEIEIKFVTSNVGVFEGKMREPALILNVWY
jgi:hypothetical protein